MDHKFSMKKGRAGAAIAVRVTARSSKTGISAILEDGTIKIKITSAPVDGKANEELIRYLAEIFNISKNNIEILAGQTSKNKMIAIMGIDSDRVNELIHEAIEK